MGKSEGNAPRFGSPRFPFVVHVAGYTWQTVSGVPWLYRQNDFPEVTGLELPGEKLRRCIIYIYLYLIV